jgi:hypothetical protein
MRWARGGRPPVTGWRRAARLRRGGAIIPPRSRHSRPDVPVITRSEDQHGPLLRSLRQGFDGWLQSPVIGDEPRSRPPSLPAESPALHHHPEGRRNEGARLHSLPPNVDEELQVAISAAVRGRTNRPVAQAAAGLFMSGTLTRSGAPPPSPVRDLSCQMRARGILRHGWTPLEAGETELSSAD